MRIETGSQNASRIEGLYAYPKVQYNRAPLEAVDKVQGRNRDTGAAAREESRVQQLLQSRQAPVRVETGRGSTEPEFKTYSDPSAPRNHNHNQRDLNSRPTGLHLNMLV